VSPQLLHGLLHIVPTAIAAFTIRRRERTGNRRRWHPRRLQAGSCGCPLPWSPVSSLTRRY